MNVVVSGADFIARIDEVLHSTKKNRNNLCKDLGMSSGTLSGWISRNTIPAGNVCLEIANYLNVSVEWLLTGSDNSNPAPQYQTFLNDVMALPEYDFEELQAIVKIKKDRLQKVTV